MNEDQDDRPAPDGPRAEVDVARGAFGQLDVVVERFEERLARAPDSGQPCAVEAVRSVAEGRRRAVAARGERDRPRPRARRRAPARTGSAGTPGRGAATGSAATSAWTPVCSASLAAAVADEHGRRRISACRRRTRGADGRSGDRVEVDDRDDAVAIAVVRDEVLDAEASERAGVASTGRESSDSAAAAAAGPAASRTSGPARAAPPSPIRCRSLPGWRRCCRGARQRRRAGSIVPGAPRSGSRARRCRGRGFSRENARDRARRPY